MPSPTARTLTLLRAQGGMAEVVERYNQYARVRHDLYGFIDILCVWPDQPGVLGIQATTTENITHRLEKFRTPEIAGRIMIWLGAGNRLAIWGWSKRGPRGKRKTWIVREVEINLLDLAEAAR